MAEAFHPATVAKAMGELQLANSAEQ